MGACCSHDGRLLVPRPTAPLSKQPTSADLALLDAADTGDLVGAREARAAGAQLAGARTEGGSTPLLLAAYEGHADMVRYLLAEGDNVDAKRDADGCTALRLAAGNGHVEVVDALLERGADASIAADDEWAPLEVAVFNDTDAELGAALALQHSAKRLAFGKSLHERLAPESPVAVLPADLVLLVLETAEGLGSCFAQVARRIEAHEERRRRRQAKKAGAGEDLCSSEEEDISCESWCAACRTTRRMRTEPAEVMELRFAGFGNGCTNASCPGPGLGGGELTMHQRALRTGRAAAMRENSWR